jgi:hypothetical protein
MNDADDPAFTHTMMRGLVAATLGQVTVLSLMKGFGRFRAQRSSPPLLYPPRLPSAAKLPSCRRPAAAISSRRRPGTTD